MVPKSGAGGNREDTDRTGEPLRESKGAGFRQGRGAAPPPGGFDARARTVCDLRSPVTGTASVSKSLPGGAWAEGGGGDLDFIPVLSAYWAKEVAIEKISVEMEQF